MPYDATASARAGAREGPEAIIAASRELEDYDLELGWEPSSAGIYTAPPVEPYLGSPEGMVARVRDVVGPWAADGKLVAVLGGDHSVSLGAVEAMAERYPDLSVLYLDAHGDLRDEYLGTRWGHASVARRLLERCRVVLVGVRSLSAEEAEFVSASALPLFSPQADPEEVLLGLSSRHTYVSLDLDVLDPALMPAVGTPEPGGLGWTELLRLLRRVAEQRTIVGFDVVELCPAAGPPACASVAAKLAYKLMGYALGGTPSHRP